ncbi:MAG TPA: response regulator [Micropepsaceae bacterium]|jgi:DNA-binding NtrC family response regulator
MNILVVDDEPAILKALQTILTLDGHTVHATVSPHEAIETLRAADTPFDLTITDQTMPSMSGPELARAVKAVAPSMPIVLLTGVLLTGMPGVSGPDRPPCIDYVLQKPIRLAELRKFMSDFAQRVTAEAGAR